MTQCIFQAGFVWRVVNNKWDDFEEVFFGFPPDRILMLSPDQVDRFAEELDPFVTTIVIDEERAEIHQALRENCRILVGSVGLGRSSRVDGLPQHRFRLVGEPVAKRLQAWVGGLGELRDDVVGVRTGLEPAQ